MPVDRTATPRPPLLPAWRRWVRSLPVVGPLCRYVKRRVENHRERAAEQAGANWGEPWMKLVALPEFRIFVDRADQLIGKEVSRRGGYELHVTAVLRRLLQSGHGFLDVGANIGFHTLLAARRVGGAGRVVAVEMMPRNCDLLRASIRANGFGNVTVHQVAAAEQAQTLTFCHSAGTGNGMLVSDYVQGLSETGYFSSFMTAQAVAVDDLLPANPPIHLVKMDIEGAEVRALRGMDRLLRTQRPKLVFEFYPHLLRNIGGVEPLALLQAVRSYGYEIRGIDRGDGAVSAPLSDGQATALVEADAEHQYADLLAVPLGS